MGVSFFLINARVDSVNILMAYGISFIMFLFEVIESVACNKEVR